MAADEHSFVGIWALLFVALISIALALGHIIRKYKVTVLPESVAAMLLGFVAGGLIVVFNEDSQTFVTFQPELFFYVLLPPIIFEAGYTLKKKKFFTNMGSILLFAIVGTIISAVVIGYGLYSFATAGVFEIDGSQGPIECLLYGSLLSATDPVATLAILGGQTVGADPLLYSLVFGESLLNDAVAIVLFNTFKGFSGKTFGRGTIFELIGIFLGVAVGSFCIGVVLALLCSFSLKRLSKDLTAAYEFIIILFFAYSAYIIPEIIGLSGIMSLFFCGVVLSHYNWYNISSESQATTKNLFKAFAIISETFLFAYLGITAVISFESSATLAWSAKVMFSTLFWVLLSRAANVFPLAFIANCRRKKQKISFRMQIVMWMSGMRGAIAFALSLNLTTQSRPYLITSTIFVILFTTFVFGPLTAPVINWLGLNIFTNPPAQSPAVAAAAAAAAEAASSSGGSGSDNPLVDLQSPIIPDSDPHPNGTRPEMSKFAAWFKRFDDQYLKAWFGGKIHGGLSRDEFVREVPEGRGALDVASSSAGGGSSSDVPPAVTAFTELHTAPSPRSTLSPYKAMRDHDHDHDRDTDAKSHSAVAGSGSDGLSLRKSPRVTGDPNGREASLSLRLNDSKFDASPSHSRTDHTSFGRGGGDGYHNVPVTPASPTDDLERGQSRDRGPHGTATAASGGHTTAADVLNDIGNSLDNNTPKAALPASSNSGTAAATSDARDVPLSPPVQDL